MKMGRLRSSKDVQSCIGSYILINDDSSMFCFCSRYAVECDPPEWKERGTGDVRIMKKEDNQSARILMRREKTLKVCANHFITPWMDMKPNCGSQKAWVWKTQADFADEEVKQEVCIELLKCFLETKCCSLISDACH